MHVAAVRACLCAPVRVRVRVRSCSAGARGHGVSVVLCIVLAHTCAPRTPAVRLGSLADFGGTMARGVLAHAALALGTITAAVDLTMDYLRTRKQFGQPLMSFQALMQESVECMSVSREIAAAI